MKKDIVQHYFRSLMREVDIVCLQELKLRGFKFQALDNFLWLGAKFLGQEAQIAYNNDHNEDGAGSGGLGMWIAPPLVHLICDSGSSRAGNAQWVRLKGIFGTDIGVLNVYAPHSLVDRRELWMELITILPRDCRWVMAGDWNFVERRADKSNARASSVSETQKRFFQELKELL